MSLHQCFTTNAACLIRTLSDGGALYQFLVAIVSAIIPPKAHSLVKSYFVIEIIFGEQQLHELFIL